MNAWLELIKTAFLAMIGVSKAVEVRTKPVEIQLQEAERKDARLDGNEFERIYEECFDELKGKVELDVATYVRYKCESMSDTQKDRLIMLLTARVIQHRKDVVKLKGLKWRKFRDWLEDNKLT